MKTERRQELRTNELGSFLLDLTDWTRKYTVQIGVVAVAGVVMVLAVRYMQSSRQSDTDAAVATMAELAFTPEEADASFATLDNIIRDTGDRDLRMSALLRKASIAMNLSTLVDGFQPQYLDRSEQAYRELLQNYPERMPVVAASLSSLATIAENRFVVDQDAQHRSTAEGYLTRLRDDAQFKGTPFQTDAADRLLHMDDVFEVIVLAAPLPPPPAPEPDASDASDASDAPAQDETEPPAP